MAIPLRVQTPIAPDPSTTPQGGPNGFGDIAGKILGAGGSGGSLGNIVGGVAGRVPIGASAGSLIKVPVAPPEQNPTTSIAPPAATPTTTPSATNTLTPNQLDSLDDLIGNLSGYQPNPLNPFMNVAYKIKLYMVGDDTIQAISTTGISLSNMLSILDNADQVVIAQSGVTAGYNITSAEIVNLATGDATVSITLTIYETLSASLFDAMAAAALQVGAQNMQLIPYILEIGFTGYDQNGNTLENVLSNSGLTNGGRWVYKINIGAIDTTFDSGGATYIFDCKIDSDASSHSDDDLLHWPKSKSPVAMTCSGNTIGEMFKDIGDHLTKAWNEIYPNVYTFKFVIHPARIGDTSDPSSASLAPSIRHKDSIRVTQGTNKAPTITIPQGEDIQKIVHSIFASAEQSQQKAKAVPKINAINESNTQSTSTKSRDIYVPTLRLVVDQVGFDTNYMIYRTNITFHIWSQASMIPLSKQDILDANNSDIVNAQLAKFRSQGFFQKRYDYVHTGLNTEVKSFDVKFNVMWSAQLPNFEGYRLTNESISTHELYGDAQKTEQPIGQIKNQTSSAPTKPSTVLITNSSTSIPATNSKTSTSTSTSNSEQDPTLSTNSTSATSPTNTVFAEDLSNPTAKVVAFQQKPPTTISSAAMTAPHGRDRGLMGAILERVGSDDKQLGSTGMINATMTIRGDPFWMGYTNLETKAHDEGSPPDLSSSVELANITESANYMLVTLSYPLGFNTDGSPNFGNQGKKTNFFNGIYTPQQITHHFEGGEFYQTLALIQNPLLQLVEGATIDSSGNVTTTGTPTPTTT